MVFYLDPEMVNDPTVKNLEDVTMSYTFSRQITINNHNPKMSAEKKHDYHLVDPSPWPIYTSFSCLVLEHGSSLLYAFRCILGVYLGLALLIYGAYMWFGDVVIEAEHQGHHTPVVQIHHRYGMALFIASEVMFFVAWFWAYFDVSLFPNEFVGNVWPPKILKLLILGIFH